MNICITNYDTAPEFIGGIKRVSSILAKEWAKDCKVYFIAISPEDNQFKEICGIPQFHLPTPKDILSDRNIEYFINFINEKKIDIILHQYSNIERFTELCINAKKKTGIKLITTRHFAISHNNDVIKRSFFIKYKLGKSPVAWFKDLLFFLKYHMYKKMQDLKQERQFYKYLIENSDKFILLSTNYVKDIIEYIKLDVKDCEKLYAINNPIETIEYDFAEKEKKVLWCGRVEYGMKRIDRMLRIWKDIATKHSDWELIVMGSGNIKAFKSLVKRKGIKNVTFTGHCNPIEYYRSGSILCMTSSTEGLPMVILEAQIYGCIPIVYNSFSSLDEVIIDGVNGYKIPAFDKEKFAGCLERLMENEEERTRMIGKCQESVKRFDAKIIAQQWIRLFQEILDNYHS